MPTAVTATLDRLEAVHGSDSTARVIPLLDALRKYDATELRNALATAPRAASPARQALAKFVTGRADRKLTEARLRDMNGPERIWGPALLASM